MATCSTIANASDYPMVENVNAYRSASRIWDRYLQILAEFTANSDAFAPNYFFVLVHTGLQVNIRCDVSTPPATRFRI
jgi:hypothetical protein